MQGEMFLCAYQKLWRIECTPVCLLRRQVLTKSKHCLGFPSHKFVHWTRPKESNFSYKPPPPPSNPVYKLPALVNNTQLIASSPHHDSVYKRKHRVDYCTQLYSPCLTVWQPMRTHQFQICKETIMAHQHGLGVVGSWKGLLAFSTNLTCFWPQMRVSNSGNGKQSQIHTSLENKYTRRHVCCLYRTKSFGISTSFTVRKQPDNKKRRLSIMHSGNATNMHTCIPVWRRRSERWKLPHLRLPLFHCFVNCLSNKTPYPDGLNSLFCCLFTVWTLISFILFVLLSHSLPSHIA